MRWIALAVLLCLRADASTGVRVLFGIGDRTETKWDGSARSTGAEIKLIEPWRFEGGDAITGSSWRASTHPIQLFGGRGLFGNVQELPIVANGVVLSLSDAPDAEIAVQTAQGNFSFRLRDIPYGKSIRLLNGRAMADRVPVSVQLTNSAEEQDYPAAAQDRNGDTWVAYVEFKHNPDHNALRANMRTPGNDFSKYKAPTGGDQVLLRKLTGGGAIAISPPGGDTYRPAVTVDSQGKVWVFWSQNDGGNFDLWARPVAGGTAGAAIRITREPGSDVFPVAATDSGGKAWVAWQGWRDGKAAIFSVRQNGSGFGPAMTVSSSSGNEWNPAIAADSTGRVTVAWDSYRNGNYDIYMRTATDGRWGPESVIAATPRYEAYPSIAYDSAGRLWVAYEEGSERWGKDFGATDTTGVALYQGRVVRLIGFDKQGAAFTTAVDPGTVLPGTPSKLIERQDRQADTKADWLQPKPNLAKNRPNNRGVGSGPQNAGDIPKNSLPRISFDSSGRLWLAVRSVSPVWWHPAGTVWTEWVASYDGSAWTGPIFLPHSDNILDNRPALISSKAGELSVIGSADGRRQFHTAAEMVSADPVKNALWENAIALGSAVSAPATTAMAKPTAAAPEAPGQEEKAAVARLRAYRIGNLKIVRGEFHRHSEISMDGGSDGSLLDQWRYALDTAAMDWIGCCDHDNGNAREYSWWTEQKLTDIFYTPGKFSPMFSYERSVTYPEGHRNTIFAQRGVRVLPRLLPVSREDTPGPAPDTQMLYAYLKYFDGIVASHSSGTEMGTDWRDSDPLLEPAVEIFQGDRQSYERPDSPRSNSANDSLGGWRPKGFVNLALEKGIKLGFQASSDHVSTHISYANLLVTEATRAALLDAFKKRHIYATTDNIVADVRSGTHIMGDAFSSSTAPELHVKFEGTAPFARVTIIRDNAYVYTTEPNSAKVDFVWRDMSPQAGKTSYYYVRGEQANGEIVWASPMWITYTGR
ncbi:MAG: hypothetical protein LAP38_27685 [Acidobacteriia bacterium]|nr:hypothetical protein [Terriglobia bacterium]